MYKKISGVDQSGDIESVRSRIRNAHATFESYRQGFEEKKQEYREMKAENELEREQLRKEERMAKSFKFTKMSKRVPFLPSLH